MRRSFDFVRVMLALAGFAAILSAGAAATPAANDIAIQVGIGTKGIIDSRTTALSSFSLSLIVSGSSAGPVTVAVKLPQGLSWEAGPPSAAEGCSGTADVTCSGTLQTSTGGTYAFWAWRVVAAQTGNYAITASATSPETDPDLSNNSFTFRFDVVDPASGGGGSGGGGGGGGGGAATVSAGAAKLTPAKPKAGSLVTASVRVTAGGAPVRPTSVACNATLSGAKVKGAPKAAAGTASCRYRTSKAAKGKTLRGSVSFTARGKKFTKRFSTRLG